MKRTRTNPAPSRADPPQPAPSRRAILAGLGALGGVLAAPIAARASSAKFALGDPRGLSITHARTGERFSGVYYDDGAYLPDAMTALDKLLRDYQVNVTTLMDVRLIDLLASVQQTLGGRELRVTSGFRTEMTNLKLRYETGRAVVNSMHVQGMAADFFISGISVPHLSATVAQFHAGGVGRYDTHHFVHADVGQVRSWRG